MISSKLYLALACLLAAAATVTAALADSTQPQIERAIKLKDRAEVWSQAVCLNDLVDDGWVAGRCVVDKAACCHWNLGGASTRTFMRAELQAVLAKVSFGGFAPILNGASEISVIQTRRPLSEAEIRAKLRTTAAGKLADDVKNISVTSLRLATPIYVPLEQESDWDIVLPEPIAAHMTAKIISTADAGQSLGWAQVVLRQDSDAFVAKRTIHPQDSIKLEDFDLRKTDILAAQNTGQQLYRKDQFPDSVRARQSIMPGTMLTDALIERVPSVRLGETVTLILRGDNLKISTKGVVQGTAAVGDMVTVQLSRYSRTFRGRLMEGKLVEVWL